MITINDLNKTIEKIHNYIYANDGLNNFEALEEILKVFYIKTYDEQHENRLHAFQSETQLLSDIDRIFHNIMREFPSLFEKGVKINLKLHTLIYVIKELQAFYLSNIKSDLKGHMMQRIIDRSFREARGQFFTPSPVVDFIVKMIDPKPWIPLPVSYVPPGEYDYICRGYVGQLISPETLLARLGWE